MSKMAKAIAVLGVVAGLGVAALPLGVSAADPIEKSLDLEIYATVKGAISIEINNTAAVGDDKVDIAVDPDGKVVSGTAKVAVSTNSETGYTLSLAAGADGTALKEVDGENNYVTGGETIPTVADLADDGTKSTSGWGFKVNKINDADTTIVSPDVWQAVPESTAANPSVTLRVTSGKVTKEETILTFGVRAKSDQKAAKYKGKVTLTATVNE